MESKTERKSVILFGKLKSYGGKKRCTSVCMKSRIEWLKWGDQNTKYFHATTVQRRQRNKISMLRLEDQTWSRDPETLKQHICHFYQSLFTLAGDQNYQPLLEQCQEVVSEEMNANLIKPVTKDEVKAAIFQLEATKAPGPDGLNGLFYQNQWSLINEDIFSMVQSFFRHGTFEPKINRTHITLIPKITNP